VNLQKANNAASYAGWITSENPTSGPYQGTTDGSVAALVIGTDGFGAVAVILGRPGHARRLRALLLLHAIFVHGFPRKKRPFYTYPEDSRITMGFDCLFRGLEITTGSRRINEYQMLLDNVEKIES
jgi:hypothetical protein